MVSFGRSKRVINIVIEDYVIRMVENNGEDLNSIKLVKEKEIPQGIIKNGVLVDELQFFVFMKGLVREWKIKNRPVRFYVPQSLVILRDVTVPNDVKSKEEIKQYITMEIGNTIHFPFQDPIFDLYDVPKDNDREHVTIFAASEEEIAKYMHTFIDSSLKPIKVDIQPLGVYRYYFNEHLKSTEDKVYLFFELNLTSLTISIFNQHKIEFTRHQSLNVQHIDWEAHIKNSYLEWTFLGDQDVLQEQITDQLAEIERLMSFYQYSVHTGNKTVTDIIVLGDMPQLENVVEQIQALYPLSVQLLQNSEVEINKSINNRFIPALGLAIKGVK